MKRAHAQLRQAPADLDAAGSPGVEVDRRDRTARGAVAREILAGDGPQATDRRRTAGPPQPLAGACPLRSADRARSGHLGARPLI